MQMQDMKVITHPVTGHKVGFGRKKSKALPPMLRMRNYRLATSATPPTTINYTGPSLTGLSNILANDVLGDCTSAAALHIEDVFRGNAKNGQPMMDRAQAVKFYSLSCGYVPGNPATDQGGDLVTVMNYWRSNGLFNNGTAELAAYLAVDPTNVAEMQTAIWWAENLYMGLDLPDAWINPFPSANGFVWDVAGNPDENNGHCITALGYNAQGLIIDTWGFLGTMTWAAVAKYLTAKAGGEVYTLMSYDMINKQTHQAPVGMIMPALLAHIDALAA